jgi:acetoin utilization protein AcuB
MFVKDRMNSDPICGSPDMPVLEAQELMKEEGIRHLPIIDKSRHLLGLITPSSVQSALPSDVSSFSRFEISYTLSKIKVHSVMVQDVITIDPDTPIENAAYVMAEKKIGTLPVVQDGTLVGIISDTNLFLTMTSLLGAKKPGIRITVQQPDQSGVIARLTNVLADEGGYLSVCVGYYNENQSDQWISVCKVQNIEENRLVEVVNNIENTTILDIRKFQETK